MVEAEAVYERILSRRPTDHNALEKLGFIKRMTGRLDEALSLMTKLAGLLPNVPAAHVNVGNVLVDLGRAEEAYEHLTNAVQLKPDMPTARFALGSACLATGRVEEAEQHLGATLRLTGGHGEALRLLSLITDVATDDAIIDAMQRMLTRPDLDDRSRMHLHYGLGNAFEKLGQFDKAFARFSMANGLIKRSGSLSLDLYRDYFQDLRETFDTRLIERLEVTRERETTPIFVVGLPRCGSTVLETMLSRHGSIGAGGEVNYLTEEVSRKLSAMTGARFPGCLTSVDSKTLEDLGQAYLDRLSKLAPGKTLIVDKNLAHFQVIGLIRVLLPHARVVHVTRDPMDLGLSIFKNFFPENLPFYSDLGVLGRYYRLYQELMEQWRQLLPGFVLDISYEKLVADPETQMRRVLEFCGLDWQSDCLSPEGSDRSIRTISAMEARKPLHQRSIGAWKRYETHLKPLKEALQG